MPPLTLQEEGLTTLYSLHHLFCSRHDLLFSLLLTLQVFAGTFT